MVNYDAWLNGTLWPSESTDTAIPVEEMPPQHACSSLHKLLRWSTQWSTTEHQEETQRAWVRSTPLGRALTAQAIGLRDFSPTDDLRQGITNTALDAESVAKVVVRALLETDKFGAMQAAEGAMATANYLLQHNFHLVRGS